MSTDVPAVCKDLSTDDSNAIDPCADVALLDGLTVTRSFWLHKVIDAHIVDADLASQNPGRCPVGRGHLVSGGVGIFVVVRVVPPFSKVPGANGVLRVGDVVSLCWRNWDEASPNQQTDRG